MSSIDLRNIPPSENEKANAMAYGIGMTLCFVLTLVYLFLPDNRVEITDNQLPYAIGVSGISKTEKADTVITKYSIGIAVGISDHIKEYEIIKKTKKDDSETVKEVELEYLLLKQAIDNHEMKLTVEKTKEGKSVVKIYTDGFVSLGKYYNPKVFWEI